MRLLEKIHQEQGLPFDPAVVRVILPYNKQTRFYNIQGDIAPPGSHQLPSRTLLTYGSSITQGYTASLPTGTYAMQLARHLSADLLNRGVAGAAQMEPAMAKMIAGAPWDMALLEMGINVFGTWDEETYSRRISEFIDIIVRAHPDRWVFCIDLYTHTGDFTCNPKTASFRNILQKKAESLQAEGYQKIRHIRGDSILDISSGLTIDLVHPANPGMERMALNLADRILKLTSPV
ncbi:MAG TPA: hypothetical protein DD727_00170 [Clostridiales bacterium]|nr:hypothetical protein [Clostridiales bacterium]